MDLNIDFARKIYAEIERVLEKRFYGNFEVQFSYGEYFTIDFIFVFYDMNNSYKYFFTNKNNNSTWFGLCYLIEKLIKDNLTFKGFKKI